MTNVDHITIQSKKVTFKHKYRHPLNKMLQSVARDIGSSVRLNMFVNIRIAHLKNNWKMQIGSIQLLELKLNYKLKTWLISVIFVSFDSYSVISLFLHIPL